MAFIKVLNDGNCVTFEFSALLSHLKYKNIGYFCLNKLKNVFFLVFSTAVPYKGRTFTKKSPPPNFPKKAQIPLIPLDLHVWSFAQMLLRAHFLTDDLKP